MTAPAHTINPGTVSNVVVGLAGVRMSTSNGHPDEADHVGYTEDGCQVTYTPTVEDIRVAEEKNPIRTILVSEETKIAFAMAEASMANFNYAIMGSDNDITKLIRIGDNEAAFYSLMIEGEAPGENSGIRRILAQKVGSTGTTTVAFQRNSKQMIPIELTCYVPTLGPVIEIYDCWEFTVATGAIATYTTAKNSMLISGEGGSADTLDTVTPATGTPTVGDRLILRCASATQAITVNDDGGTPGTGTFAMADNADYILDDPRMWIEFAHHGTTQWTEVTRGPAY